MTTALHSRSDYLLYDGECPFCSAYVRMQRLRAAGVKLALVDAREEPELVAYHASKGRDINEGMILQMGTSTYFGADVMHVVSLMTGPTGFMNRLTSKVFSNQSVAHFLYPFLRAGRNMTLQVLGRRKLDTPMG